MSAWTRTSSNVLTREDGFRLRRENYTAPKGLSYAWMGYYPDGSPVLLRHDPDRIKKPARRKWWNEDRAMKVIDQEFPLPRDGKPRLEITPDTVVVNVNRQVIDKNTKWGTNEPPVRIQQGRNGKPTYGHEIAVLDKNGEECGRFIYRADGALMACGARLVLVAHYGAKVVD